MENRQYRNFCIEKIIDNYPYGLRQKTKAVYTVEKDEKKGERIKRVTYHPIYGVPNKPHRGTYEERVRIAEAEDNKLYVLKFATHSGNIYVHASDLKTCVETIRDNDSRYKDILNQMYNS